MTDENENVQDQLQDALDTEEISESEEKQVIGHHPIFDHKFTDEEIPF